MTIFCPNGHGNPDANRFCQACGSQLVQPTAEQATVVQPTTAKETVIQPIDPIATTPIANEMTSGTMLGERYRLKNEIGQGGFGRTYLCEDVNRFNELCVLKEFAPQVQGTAFLTKAQELFEREAGVMYRLQHPQIPRFREMFRSNRNGVGQLFLVQDYVGGENYQQLLRQKLQQGKRFTEAEITEFLNQILPVLSYIHSLGVIHRDISPDNIIKRTMDGLPVLIDFGGVKQVAVNVATQYVPNNEQNYNAATRLGKVGYAPNEQMQRGIVSPQSDLYALAATSLVLLTGMEPADLIDPQNFVWNWRRYIKLTPQLGSVLDRMLQLRPSDRYSSAEDVLEALSPKATVNSSPANPVPLPQTILPPPEISTPTPKSQVETVVAVPQQQTYQPPQPTYTNAPPPEPGLFSVLGKTWAIILSVAAALGLGWVVASLTAKHPQDDGQFGIEPTPAPIIGQSNSPTPTPTTTATPTPTPSNTTSPTPTPSQSGSPTPTPLTSPTSISALKPTIPAALASRGINAQAYGDAVKQIFTAQNPTVQIVPVGDNKVQSQLDSISNDLGSKLNNYLAGDAIGRIGKYGTTDRATWRSQVNKANLSERALIDLSDAKYRSITNLSAQKLGMPFDRFIGTPLGQVYLATMADRVRAIQEKRATGEIIFPKGATSGTVRGTLLPGEGKAYISSLSSGQDFNIKVNVNNQPSKLSIYPPNSTLPAILGPTQTNNWSSRTTVNGYHEFVLVSQSDLPIQYEIALTAADIKPAQTKDDSKPGSSPSPQ
jgi:serine/threonine protein kinase, bacterial